MVDPHLSEQIRALPERPGIYVFRDTAGKPLYVGKAKSLRHRGAHYLGGDQEPRIAAMLREARGIESLVTDSEAEALLLENNWIKQIKPRYNVLLRDDKTYPYLKLTVPEETPRLDFTRRIRDDGAEYFGPFLPGGVARKAIKLVQRLFGVRVCRIEIDGRLPRPCLYYDMKRCLGPCVDGLTTRSEYDDAVRRARLFLAGRSDALRRELKESMGAAAEALEFEEAARLRNLIDEIETVSHRRKLSSVQGDDADIYGVHVRQGNAAVTLLIMRNGQVLDRREIFWEGEDGVSAAGLLAELLPQIYDRTTFIPKELHLPMPIDGDEALAAWLGEKKGERVYVRLPARGPKAQRVDLAMRNAELAFRRRFRAAGGEEEAATALRESLRLPEIPRRIEGFDVSNLQGQEMVASLVVWEEGRLRKSDYRSFNIRGLPGQDDFAALRQAVGRRYRRRLEELGAMPDLVLIDGGRGQLNAALEALAELGVDDTPVVALAKQEEELYLPERPEPMRLARNDPGLKLLQLVRDEAHRFALGRHRRRRRATTLRSRLDDLPGIGPQRRRRLLERCGSLQGVRAASADELQEILGPKLGRRVFDLLRQDAAATATEEAAGAKQDGSA